MEFAPLDAETIVESMEFVFKTMLKPLQKTMAFAPHDADTIVKSMGVALQTMLKLL